MNFNETRDARRPPPLNRHAVITKSQNAIQSQERSFPQYWLGWLTSNNNIAAPFSIDLKDLRTIYSYSYMATQSRCALRWTNICTTCLTRMWLLRKQISLRLGEKFSYYNVESEMETQFMGHNCSPKINTTHCNCLQTPPHRTPPN